MDRVKEIIVKVIPPSVANPFVRKHHYSKKVVVSSQVHFGCFLDGELHGVMSFGPSLQKRAMLSLVETDNKGEHAKWNEWLELNRMAFDDVPPSPSALSGRTRRTSSGSSRTATAPQAETAQFTGRVASC